MLYENLSNPFSLKKQIVKYGAPGTGKTYQARQQTSLLFDIWKEEFAPNSGLTHASQIEQTISSSFVMKTSWKAYAPFWMVWNRAADVANGVFKGVAETPVSGKLVFAALVLIGTGNQSRSMSSVLIKKN